ncbi:iron ABC transporter permease [Thiotrichales bacterium 19S9-12]|nr:iron ABC transporter permease [Thiotrichales bacterium 19S9-11]MCF6811775.1 iron ABC transporter permease [Thiotrichales bacterium 19S9-12]
MKMQQILLLSNYKPIKHIVKCLLLSIILGALVGAWLFISALKQPEGSKYLVVWEFMIPRILLDITSGILFSLSGALLQATLRNSMASPEILGLSSCSILAIFIAGLLGVSYNVGVFQMISFIGASFAAILICSLAKKNGKTNILQLVLIGSGIAIFSKALLQLFAVNMPPEMTALLSFMSGSTYGATWALVNHLIPWALIIVLITLFFRKKLSFLWLDELVAKSIGFPIEFVRMFALLIAVTAIAIAVTGVGNLGFVGLIAPNMALLIAKNDREWIMPYSAILGALLVIFADMLNIVLFDPIEIPVGLITTIIGTPYFIWLLRK